MRDRIRIVVVDDHPVVRDGMVGILSAAGIEIVGTGGSGADALHLVRTLHPDALVLDLRMPHMTGTDAIRTLREDGDQTPILVLTTFDVDDEAIAALRAGATGYLLKDAGRDEIIAAVRSTARRESVLAPSVAAMLVRGVRPDPAADLLTDREQEVLRLVAEGNTNAAVGRALFIGQATVKTHLLNVYAKLGVSDRAAAVDAAHRRGIL
ncbi:response regulator transcription factor [Microbacterium rhizosphaerae]|uniref:Response regulator transcription factor n=1 Tax=Microbacterium rhizosphaerae TaxID=1678237 RepID=A0ABZ0SI02_9MICO|nr:response regulator transcription factor [Microbacterium rhizosphaerae]WPR88005.1 response regulator transcription factor [Microbacterium rhizosphaerae]